MNRKRWFRYILNLLLVLALLAVPLAALAAQEGDEGAEVEPEGDELVCNPVVASLAVHLELDCEDLLDFMAKNNLGLGEVMKAWVMAQRLDDYSDNFDGLQALLELRRPGEADGETVTRGWGEIKIAMGLASVLGDPDFDVATLLEMKKSGDMGWGQFRKAQALAEDLGVDFETALAWMEAGMGWDEIRADQGIEETGPPPWAGPPVWKNANPGKGNKPEQSKPDKAKGPPSVPPGQAKKNKNGD